MADRDELRALAQRVMALAGPCEKTDAAILYDVLGVMQNHKGPAFTASLDAAMTLVPEGWLLSELHERNASGVQNWRWKAALWDARAPRPIGHDAPIVSAYARKAHDAKCAPALALTAAALLALADEVPE